jgi:two-component system LytT family sensor kinase
MCIFVPVRRFDLCMKDLLQKIFKILTSRIALNVYIWTFFIDTVYNNNFIPPLPPGNWGYLQHIVWMHLIWFALIYGNTLVLVPRLFLRRKYIVYIVSVLAYAGIFSFIIGAYSEWLIHAFPGTRKYQYITISLISRDEVGSYWDYYLNIYLSGVLTTLILFTIGCLMQHFFKERRRNELLQKKQTESELMLLRSQVNPHFLFNVLNSIYSLSLKKSDDTPGVILKLSDILRYMLYESRQEFVPLEKELQMLRNYIAIEKIRISNKEAIDLNIVHEGHSGYIAPVMLISFVENAIKHGLDSRAADAFVMVKIEADPQTNWLHFYCYNNYLPRTQNGHTSKVGGIGLENVKKRLELLYPGRHELTIKNENNLFEVTLNIKLTPA